MTTAPAPAAADPVSPDALQRVTIVLVTYNSRHCLPDQHSLVTACPHVIVVDNASEDGTPAWVRHTWPHVHLLDLPTNVGFGSANNRAIACAHTEWVLLLNPDCNLSPETLRRLVAWGDAFPEAVMLAPQLIDSQGRTQINYRWSVLDWTSRGEDKAQGPLCVGFACGAAMMLRRSHIPAPVFDETFFLYYEDDDLCLRLLRQQKAIVLIPDCVAQHRSRGSVRMASPWRTEYQRGYHHAQSKLHFIAKHRDLIHARRLRSRLLLATVITLPMRLALPTPKVLGRGWGRLCGLLQWLPHATLAAPRQKGGGGGGGGGADGYCAAESIIKCNTLDLTCNRACHLLMGTHYQHLSAEERATIMSRP